MHFKRQFSWVFGIVLLVSGYLLGTMLFDVPATENKLGIGTNKKVSKGVIRLFDCGTGGVPMVCPC